MTDSKSTKQLSTLTFIGMTLRFSRKASANIPDVAATGWTMLFLYVSCCTLLCVSDLSDLRRVCRGCFLKREGQNYGSLNPSVENGDLSSLGFLWVQMFPGMVMVASALAPLFGNMVNNVPLGLNSKFTLLRDFSRLLDHHTIELKIRHGKNWRENRCLVGVV